MKEIKWKRFEKLVAHIQKNLTPDATIHLNRKIPGALSEGLREVDVIVEPNKEYKGLIAFNCKDYNKPMDLPDMESTIGLMEDVGASVGVVVSAKGFTERARKRGHKAGLILYKIVDTGEHEWKTEVTFPAICYVKNLTTHQFIFTFIGNGPFPIENDFVLYDNNGDVLKSKEELLLDWWLNENNRTPLGEHEAIEFLDFETFFKSKENDLQKVEVTVNILVEELIYFKRWPLDNISGFEDQITKHIETRGFTLSKFNLEDLKDNWEKVDDPDSYAPLIIFSITTCTDL